MSVLAGWRLALRVAWREALRAKARSVLVLIMIALPVTAVVAADVLIRTGQISTAEGEDTYLGHTAAARVAIETNRVEQETIDPFGGDVAYGGDGRPRHTLADVRALLGTNRTYVPIVASNTTVPTTDGASYADVLEYDPAQPLTDGLARLNAGRWPTSRAEIVVNAAYADHGAPLGSVVTLPGPRQESVRRTVVGVVESPLTRAGYVVQGLPGSVPLPAGCYSCTSWLVDGADVTWAQVLQLNRIGAVALSRAVVADPPDLSQYDDNPITPTVIAVALMIVVMALLEVVLLAGPAIAVGAKRQARSLALISASGGTPAQSRRTILATGVVLGAGAAAIGLGMGIGLARLALPVLQGHIDTWLGPFDVRPREVLGVAAFGFASALLAAVVPAWIAARQDVVAVLAGRRGDRRPSLKTPVLGLLTVGAGIVAALAGTRTAATSGAVLIAASALISVIGMIMLVPVVVVAVAWLGARLPLPLRFAVRDAVRHRARTVPAVAAVAAVVAGAVTLGIALASDNARNSATYFHTIPIGDAEINAGTARVDWEATETTVRTYVPGATVTPIDVAEVPHHPGLGFSVDIRPSEGGTLVQAPTSGFGPAASDIVVDDGRSQLPYPDDVTEADQRAARQMLARGGAVIFTGDRTGTSTVRIVASLWNGRAGVSDPTPVRVPALYLRTAGEAPAAVIAPPVMAQRMGLAVAQRAAWVTGVSIGADTEQRLREALATEPGDPNFAVERGYQPDSTTRVLEIVLVGLAALLMLGGTLTTTFLSLSDARPDLATLAAVGAAPRTRRLVGAAYALSLGLVGAILGLGVGMIPGYALTYPITGSGWSPPGSDLPSHYLVVPWGMLAAIVIGAPVLVAVLVGVCTRSRLPMVARLS